MKKVFKLIVGLIFLLTLSSCISNKEYKVTFYSDDEVVFKTKVIKGNYLEPFNLEEKDGMSYDWYLKHSFIPFDFENTKINSNLELYARWEEQSYDLTFILANREITVTYSAGEEIRAVNPNILGYNFLGWDQKIPKVMPNQDLTIKGNYEYEEYEITFIDEYDQVIETLTVNYFEEITPPKVEEKEGYTHFWMDGNTRYNFNGNRYSSLTLKSKYLETKDEYHLNVYYLNDTHGAVLNKGDELGLANIGNYLNDEYSKNPDSSIFITGGDILQGQLISNNSKGEIMIDIFNHLNLDAFVIGNHEFDWGLEEVLKYFDPNYTGIKANFPILGANVKRKSDGLRPNFIDSYTIVEKDGLNVGIIGVIGDGLESSISTLRVKDYYFSDAYQAVLETANEILSFVDTILVVNHSNSQSFNQKVGEIDKVSAIFNGHSHTTYTGYINNKVPYIQSGSNGKMVGKVSLEFNGNFEFVKGNAKNINNDERLYQADQFINNLINSYYEDIRNLYEETLLVARNSIDKNDLAIYIAKVMKEATNAAIGFQNSGGTREDITAGQNITGADLFQIFPFDNQIVYTKVTGKELKELYNDSYLIKSNTLNLNEINDNELYTVATNDYIFYSSHQNFAFGNKTPNLYGDMYETFYEVMLNLKEEGHTYFDSSSPIIIGG